MKKKALCLSSYVQEWALAIQKRLSHFQYSCVDLFYCTSLRIIRRHWFRADYSIFVWLQWYFKSRQNKFYSSCESADLDYIHHEMESFGRFPDLVMEGWVFHFKTQKPFSSVVGCLEGRTITSTSKHLVRSDVWRHFKRECPAKSGFSLLIDSAGYSRFEQIQLFALFPTGEAVPLNRTANVPIEVLDPVKQKITLLEWGNSIYSVKEMIKFGFIDNFFFTTVFSPAQFDQLISQYPIILKAPFFIEIFRTSVATLLKEGDQGRLLEFFKKNRILLPSNYLDRLFYVRSIKDAASSRKIKMHEIRSDGEFRFQLPRVYPKRLDEGRDEEILVVPSEQLYEINDATVFFGNIVTQGEDYLVLDASANPSFDFIAGHWRHVHGSARLPDQCFIFGELGKKIELDEGILLDGRVSANYFHWLIEYLPRLATLNEFPELSRLPLIVADNKASTMKEVLSLVAPNHPVIWVSESDQICVKKLYVPSMFTFIPDTVAIPLEKGGVISVRQMQWFRERVMSHLPSLPSSNSRRLYVHRKSGLARAIVNEEEVIQAFVSHGFEVVDPSELSFLEQVYLFASASAIAGTTGAAFANLIFCQPGTQIIALVMEANENFSIQSNLAGMVGCSYLFISGPSEKARIQYKNPYEYMHSSFWIPIYRVHQALDFSGL